MQIIASSRSLGIADGHVGGGGCFWVRVDEGLHLLLGVCAQRPKCGQAVGVDVVDEPALWRIARQGLHAAAPIVAGATTVDHGIQCLVDRDRKG